MGRDIGLRIVNIYDTENVVRTTDEGHGFYGSFRLEHTRDNLARILSRVYRYEEWYAAKTAGMKWMTFIEGANLCDDTYFTLFKPTLIQYMKISRVLRSYDTTYNKKAHVFKREDAQRHRT